MIFLSEIEEKERCVSNLEMSKFCSDQGRTRVFGCGILPVFRRRKPAENADPGKKGHLWMEIR